MNYLNFDKILSYSLDCISRFNSNSYPLKNTAKDIINEKKLNSKERKVFLDLVFLWCREVNLVTKYLLSSEKFFNSLSYNQKQQVILKILLTYPDEYKNFLDDLGDKKYSLMLGEKLFNLISKSYNQEEVINIAKSLFEPSIIYVAVDETKISMSDFLQELNINNISYFLPKELDNVVAFNKKVSFSKFSPHIKNNIWYMDLGSQLIASLINPLPHEKVLDLCCGKGIKSKYLAKYSTNLTLVELDKRRIEHAKKWLNNKNLTFINTDGTKKIEFLKENNFDWILLDVPCSGVGTIKRHPDVIHRWSKLLESLINVQYALLENAIKYLKPNGKLIYSTCSILREENQDQITKILSVYKNVKLVPIEYLNSNFLFKNIEFKDCGYNLFPHIYKTDGFFICCLTKTE
jgi:16S rRNA (cytosine967-C5)-methyltransferase